MTAVTTDTALPRVRYRPKLSERVTALAPALALTVLIALIVVPPVVSLIGTSLTGAEGQTGTLANYARLFADPRLYQSAWNSVLFSVLAMLLSLVNGGVVAWLVERTNTPLKSFATVSAIVSLGTPYIIYVGAWLYLLGKAGPLNVAYRTWFETTDSLFNVYSITGMVLIE